MVELFAGVEGLVLALSAFGFMLWLHRMVKPFKRALELVASRREPKPKKVAALVKRMLERRDS